MFYTKDGISSCEIACAITEGILHDVRVNGSSLNGLPQTKVTRHNDDDFKVRLSVDYPRFAEEVIEFTGSEARGAVDKFRNKQGFDRYIFDRIQNAIAILERKISQIGT